VGYATGEDRSDFQRGGQTWAANDFGFTKFTESDNWKSATARANWANMKAEGVARGGYHFLHPAVSAVAQAHFFLNYVQACGGWQPGDMFACDAEISVGADGMEEIEADRLPRMHAGLLRVPEHRTGVTVGSAAKAFCDRVAELAGPACPVLLYTYVSFRSNVADCARYPLWLASYSSSPPSAVSPWPRWTFWQNSDRGGQGGGDTNRFNGDRAALHSWLFPAAPNWTEDIVNQLPTLHQGMSDQPGQNQAVGKMQALIAHVGRTNNLPKSGALTDDGSFGPATAAAVAEIQAFFKIAGGNGECGQRTWECLLLGFGG
jgi:GH25 family lysozyme M1 (1,4-beta-N-acetylmuramidase)